MTQYTERINQLKAQHVQSQKLLANINDMLLTYGTRYSDLQTLIEAQRVLVTVAEENTSKVINFIETIINKALLDMYPDGTYYISVDKTIRRGTSAAIDVTLYDTSSSNRVELDLNDQAGDGIARIISILFSLSVIELSGVRKFVAIDEVLNGFHADSLVIVKNILKLFADGGFQFIMSEYDINDMGTIYEAQRTGKDYSELLRLGYAADADYQRNI